MMGSNNHLAPGDVKGPDITTHEKSPYYDATELEHERNARALTPTPSYDDEKRDASPFPGPLTPTRRDSESSTTRSAYSGVDPVTEKAGQALKELGVFHTRSHYNIRIHDATDKPIYFVDNSTWTPNKPDVTLHVGSENTGPIIGLARWGFSSDLQIGLGDPDIASGTTVTWEDVKKTSKVKHSKYEWAMTMPETGRRRPFIWKRTHHFGLEQESRSAKWALINFKLIDAETGDIVANFAHNGVKSWKKIGKFVMRAEYGSEWEVMVLLTALGIIEKARRRERARRAAGAAGASGGGGGGGG